MKKIQNKKILINKNKNNDIDIFLASDQVTPSDLDKDEIMIRSSFSSINFKDLLVLKGNPGLVRRFPHTPGIDVSGTVISSKSKKFKVGQKVVVIARPFGLSGLGGFQKYVKIKEKWVDFLPKGMTLKQSMILGTAGFTAMIAALKLKKLKSKKSILITGGSGGVGIISALILKSWGHKITVCVRDNSFKSEFKKMGIKSTISLRELIVDSNMPLLKENYSAVIDSIGGEVLGSAHRQVEKKGIICLIGNVIGEITKLFLLPFILRGINILGINAEILSETSRKKIFFELVKFCKKQNLNKIFITKDLNYFKNEILFKKKKKCKRILIKI